jgi:hypothetical protein
MEELGLELKVGKWWLYVEWPKESSEAVLLNGPRRNVVFGICGS